MKIFLPAVWTCETWMKGVCALLLLAGGVARAQTTEIRLNSIGFLPDEPKQATVAAACTNFTVVRQTDGRAVFSNAVAGPRLNEDTG